MKYKVLLLLILSLFFSRESFAISLSLEEAIQKALKSNPELLSLKKVAYAAKRKLKASQSQRYGDIYISGGVKKTEEGFMVYPMYKEIFQAGENLPFDDKYLYYNLTYTLPLYTGGQLTESIKLLQIIQKQENLKLRSFENNLIYRVKEAYVRILTLDKKIESLRAGITALESLLSHIKDGVKTGKYPKLDLLKAQARLEEFLKHEAVISSERQSIYMALLNLIGEKEITDYTLLSCNFEGLDRIEILQPAKLLKAAFQKRSDLKLLEMQVQAKESALRLKKAERLPQITFNASYIGVDAMEIDFERGYYTVSLNLTFPIFTFGRLKNEYHSVKAERDATVNLYESKKLEIRKEIIDAWYAFKEKKAILVASEAELKLAREVEKIERLKYLNGRGRIDDLLFAIAKTVEAEADLFSAKAQLYLAYENIIRTTEGALK